MADPTPPRVCIVGLGNILRGDDGLGVHVVRAMAAGDLPTNVCVLEAGTALLDLLPEVAGCPRLLLVDALATGRPPGTLVRLDLTRAPLDQDRLAASLHQWGVLDTLRAARTMALPLGQVQLYGAEPASLEPGLELSAPLQLARDRLVDLLRGEIQAGTGVSVSAPG